MLEELERKLSSLSHSEEAVREIAIFCVRFKSSAELIAVWNVDNALVPPAIESETAAALGFNTPDDSFVLLQGDLVSTESAYYFGERVIGRPKYTVLNSSCDLVPNRCSVATLLRILEIRKSEEKAKEKLATLLRFTRRDSMYLPPLPTDEPDVIANTISFDGFCQIRTADLFLANRIASLSLVGWRIFASFARVVLARANPREVEIRKAIESGAIE